MRHYQDDVRREDDWKHFRDLRMRAEQEWKRRTEEIDWNMYPDTSHLYGDD